MNHFIWQVAVNSSQYLNTYVLRAWHAVSYVIIPTTLDLDHRKIPGVTFLKLWKFESSSCSALKTISNLNAKVTCLTLTWPFPKPFFLLHGEDQVKVKQVTLAFLDSFSIANGHMNLKDRIMVGGLETLFLGILNNLWNTLF